MPGGDVKLKSKSKSKQQSKRRSKRRERPQDYGNCPRKPSGKIWGFRDQLGGWKMDKEMIQTPTGSSGGREGQLEFSPPLAAATLPTSSSESTREDTSRPPHAFDAVQGRPIHAPIPISIPSSTLQGRSPPDVQAPSVYETGSFGINDRLTDSLVDSLRGLEFSNPDISPNYYTPPQLASNDAYPGGIPDYHVPAYMHTQTPSSSSVPQYSMHPIVLSPPSASFLHTWEFSPQAYSPGFVGHISPEKYHQTSSSGGSLLLTAGHTLGYSEHSMEIPPLNSLGSFANQYIAADSLSNNTDNSTFYPSHNIVQQPSSLEDFGYLTNDFHLFGYTGNTAESSTPYMNSSYSSLSLHVDTSTASTHLQNSRDQVEFNGYRAAGIGGMEGLTSMGATSSGPDMGYTQAQVPGTWQHCNPPPTITITDSSSLYTGDMSSIFTSYSAPDMGMAHTQYGPYDGYSDSGSNFTNSTYASGFTSTPSSNVPSFDATFFIGSGSTMHGQYTPHNMHTQ